MRRLAGFVIVFMCVVIFTSGASAWTDDVEGMLMPSPRGEDNVSDPESIMENIEPTEGESSEDSAPDIEWE